MPLIDNALSFEDCFGTTLSYDEEAMQKKFDPLKSLKELIWTCATNPVKEPLKSPMFLKYKNEIGIGLNDDQTAQYEKILTTLSPDKGEPRMLSRATVDFLIRQAMLAAVDLEGTG